MSHETIEMLAGEWWTVYLADDEWGNTLMDKVAREYLASDAVDVVTVNEHAGWSLTYALLEGRLVVVGTANDTASLSDDANKFIRRRRGCVWTYRLIRRQDAVESAEGGQS